MCNTIINKHLENLFNIDISNLICLYNGNTTFDVCKYNEWQIIEKDFIDYNILINYFNNMFCGSKFKIIISVYLEKVEYLELRKSIKYVRINLINDLHSLYIYTDEDEIIITDDINYNVYIYLTNNESNSFFLPPSFVVYIHDESIKKLIFSLITSIGDYIYKNN
jgi:hypothetical protein